MHDKTYACIRAPLPPYPDQDCIAKFFYGKAGRNKVAKFKTGTTTVFLCIVQDVYDRFQDHIDAQLSGEGTQATVGHMYSTYHNFLLRCIFSQDPQSIPKSSEKGSPKKIKSETVFGM